MNQPIPAARIGAIFLAILGCFFSRLLVGQAVLYDSVYIEKMLVEVRGELATGQIASARGRACLARLMADKGTVQRAEAAFLAGFALESLKKADKALPFLEEAMRIYSSFSTEKWSARRAEIWFSIGNCHLNLGKTEPALACHEQALQIRQQLFGDENLDVGRSFLALGKVQQARGDHGQSVELLKKAIAIRQQLVAEIDRETAAMFSALADAQYAGNQFTESEATSLLTLEIQRRILPDSMDFDLSITFNNLGRVAKWRKDYDRAIHFWERALAIRLHLFPPDDLALYSIYNNLGIGWKSKSEFKKAFEYFHRGLQIREKNLRPGHPDLATPHFNMAACFQKMGEFSRAVAHFDTAEALLSGAFQPEHPLIAETIYTRGEVFEAWANQTNDPEPLKKARQDFRKALKLTLAQQKFTRNRASKRGFATELILICEANIRTGLSTVGGLPKTPDADLWNFSESAKNTLLLDEIQDETALHFAGIPDSLFELDRRLRAEITSKQQALHQKMEAASSKTDAAVLAAEAEIFDLNRRFDALKARFEREFPDYFHLKHDRSTISLAETQRLLGPEQTLIEYFTGDSSIFIFVVRRADFQVVEIRRDFPLAEWVAQVREGISGYYMASKKTSTLYEKTVREYAAAAQNLFQKLVAPVAEWLTGELVIIPDGPLNELPFEAFLTEKPRDLSNFGTFSFLARHRTIHYEYSATMFKQMTDRQFRRQPTGDLLAFAPFFFGENDRPLASRNSGLKSLQNSGAEIFEAQKQVGGASQILTGEAATKADFMKMAGDFRILHLATHGKANALSGNFSFLVFANGEQLFVGDLYNLPLNADLVLLSACETGIGELRRGEGTVSLARAFAFAGAKSVVTSLWNVGDQSTRQLMADFYRELKIGRSKNRALAEAKRHFLENNPGLASHPFFWAGFVAVGDMGEL